MADYKVSDLKFYHEPEPNFEYMGLIKFIAGIQFILEILTIIHVSYVLSILSKIKVCHLNLRIISCVFLFELILKAVTNILVLTKLITGKTFLITSFDYIVANSLQCTSNYVYYFFPLSIFAERSVSLIWARKYERFFSPTFIITLCLIPFACSAYLTVHLMLLQHWMPIVYVYSIANAMITSCWTGYFVIYFCTKKYFVKHTNQSLSERYQRYENLRANKTMFWFAVVSWISIIIGFIYIQVFANHKTLWPLISDVNVNALLRLILDTLQAFIFLIFPISFMFVHKRLLRKYLEPFSHFSKLFSPKSRVYSEASLQSGICVKSVTGQNLVCTNEQEKYFQMLANDWGDNFQNMGIATTSV